MGSNYDLLLSKINEFTQKFYLNKLLRGSIYTAALLLAVYLLLFVGIYYTQPGAIFKTVVFFSYVIFALILILWQMVLPALSYFRLNKTLSIEQASALIGNHFFYVKDKLLNTLQLKALADQHPDNNLLILAGIDQKITELKPVPFSNAIRLKDNKKYIKYLLAPFMVILVIAIIAPAILREGTSSFVRYDQQVFPEAPFRFELQEQKLLVSQGEDLRLTIRLKGNELPQEVYVSDGLNTYKLEKENISTFHYTFKNLQKNKDIRFSAGGFSSTAYLISVKPRPSVTGIDVRLQYPAYLNKKEEHIQNSGDLLIPEGTTVNWSLKTQNSEKMTVTLGKETFNLQARDNLFAFSRRLLKSTSYLVVPGNSFITSKDSLLHQISVIADEHAGISVTERMDSLSSKALYFSGNISDDHGFSGLKFHFTVSENGKALRRVSQSIPVKKTQLEQSFFYFWNIANVNVQPGQSLEYYFEVLDNDGVNGAKATRSAVKYHEVPSTREVAKKIDAGSQALKQQMAKAIKLAGTVEKDSKKLGETLLDKKQVTFDDKKQVEQLLDKRKQLEAAVKEIQQLNQQQTSDKAENNTLNEELREKQRQIDELFNHVLDDKTKSLLEKLQQMMDQNNKEQTHDELSKMQVDNKSLKKELDRILELYKQLEYEQNLQQNIDQLKELAKKQEALSKKSNAAEQKTADRNAFKEDLKKQQRENTAEFEQIRKELQQLKEKNEHLEHPNDFSMPEKESTDIKSQQEQSEESLEKNNLQKAAEHQKKAAGQLEQMAKKMEEMQQQSEQMENNLNVQELRQLLENLLKTSFEQEKVMLSLKRLSSTDPQYTANVQAQRNIKDNMKTIADSLFSLSRRVPQIEQAVNEEMEKINFNMDKSLENLGERNTPAAGRNQQFTMTSINNLSLMLNEALDQLQNMMKNSSGGKGKKKQSMKQLQQMQEQLNENMQKAKDQLQKNGNKGQVPKGQMSQEFAKMAQQQQMIREALQQLNREENKDGKGSLGNLNQMIKDMKATETDLVNKRLEQETMNRQRQLATRLLEADNAQREQDESSKRESKAGKDFPPSYPKMLEQFKKQQETETEWLQKLPPGMNLYYKNKISTYFKLLNSPR